MSVFNNPLKRKSAFCNLIVSSVNGQQERNEKQIHMDKVFIILLFLLDSKFRGGVLNPSR